MPHLSENFIDLALLSFLFLHASFLVWRLHFPEFPRTFKPAFLFPVLNWLPELLFPVLHLLHWLLMLSSCIPVLLYHFFWFLLAHYTHQIRLWSDPNSTAPYSYISWWWDVVYLLLWNTKTNYCSPPSVYNLPCWKTKPTTPAVPRQSPIQVLSGPDAA